MRYATAAEKEQMRELRATGWSYGAIAEKFDFSKRTVQYWCDDDFHEHERERHREQKRERREDPDYRRRNRDQLREYRKDPAFREHSCDYERQSHYGVLPIHYERALGDPRLAGPGGGCFLCGGTAGKGGRSGIECKLCIDHDHDCCLKGCGKCNRGLLCRKCNNRLSEKNIELHYYRVQDGKPGILSNNEVAYLEIWKQRHDLLDPEPNPWDDIRA